jgi:SWI/SNF-related matrix-associated actin-dependent regulator of chromatin subfamily A containing DEAD/H box 1
MLKTPSKKTIIIIPETPYSPLNDIANKMDSNQLPKKQIFSKKPKSAPRFQLDDRSFYAKSPISAGSIVEKDTKAVTLTTSKYFYGTLTKNDDVEILSVIDIPISKKRKLVLKADQKEPSQLTTQNNSPKAANVIDLIADVGSEIIDSLDCKIISGPDYPRIKVNTEKRIDKSNEDVSIIREVSKKQADMNQWEKEGLSFVNASTAEELIRSLKCTQEQSDFLIGRRPFVNFDLIEETHLPLFRILYKYINALQDFGNVDDIIHHCDSVGTEVKRVMDQWIDIQNGVLISPTYPIYTTQPDIINQDLQLKQYQLTGISWMLMLHEMKLGGILADEMGLGKSAQVIGFLAILNQKQRHQALIIVPSSTLDNWMREIEMWCPTLNAIAYTGSQKERRELQYDIVGDDELDIIVTTYNQATGNSEDRRFLRSLKCNILILDEGHMIKNGDSQRAKHIKAFNAPFKMLITGTPIQNNLMELLALLIFINPALFEPAQSSFASIFDKTNTAHEGLEGDVAKKRIDHATKILTPFVLRRRKEEVRKDIPTKTKLIEYCEPTNEQTELYHFIMKASKKAFLNSNQKKKKEQSSSGLSNILMQLRKVANHQLLVRRLYNDDVLPDIARDLKRVTKLNIGVRIYG